MERAKQPISIYTPLRHNIQQPQSKIDIEHISTPIVQEKPEQEAPALSIQVLPSQQFRVGESMQIQIFNPSREDGHLLVWDINSSGQITRLFPNQYTQETSLAAGKTISFPENAMGFGLRIVEPIGDNLLVALPC